MTDNRTNEPTPEQVEAAAKALYEFETGLAEDSWGRAFEVERSLWRDEARAALEAAARAAQEAAPQAAKDIHEPNKYAGFLARQNHQRDPWRGVGAKCLCGKVFDLDANHAMHQVDEILRAALVAAQGAEPQVESDPYREETE